MDFILVAGDVFDSNLPDPKVSRQAFSLMGESFSGKWFLLPGNHDAAETQSVWSRFKRDFASENIVIMDEPRAYRMADQQAVILPAPLKRRHEARDLTEWWDGYESRPGDFRIGLAHGSLDALSQYRGEAPNTIPLARVEAAKLDYLALGDWHGTVQAGKRVAYSGTPEPDRFRANDSGNVLLVTIDAPGAEPIIEPIATKSYLWLDLDRTVFSAADCAAIKESLLEQKHPLNKIVLRLALKGTLNLEERSVLDDEIQKLTADLAYLETDNAELLAKPTSQDLDAIERSGFVRAAVEKLIVLMNDESNPEADLARLALNYLYVENKTLAKNEC